MALALALAVVAVWGQDVADDDAAKPRRPEKFVYILDPFLSGGFALSALPAMFLPPPPTPYLAASGSLHCNQDMHRWCRWGEEDHYVPFYEWAAECQAAYFQKTGLRFVANRRWLGLDSMEQGTLIGGRELVYAAVLSRPDFRSKRLRSSEACGAWETCSARALQEALERLEGFGVCARLGWCAALRFLASQSTGGQPPLEYCTSSISGAILMRD
ncbi:hypothetical protein T484DRAFT_1779194 [Baffinella frigidus]|nr:hypothetical protein T484DRAFT_1779194 [Cryptophyta sp. CCMP2293]